MCVCIKPQAHKSKTNTVGPAQVLILLLPCGKWAERGNSKR